MFSNLDASSTEALLRGMIRNMPSGVVVRDSGGRVVLANSRFLEMIGRTADQVLHHKVAEFLPPEIRQMSEEEDAKLFASGSATCVEHDIVLGDGVRRRVQTAKFQLPEVDGVGRGVAAIIKDVTDQRDLRDQLFQAQKLEGIGQLAGGVAHDFNNLLTVMLGNLELSIDLVAEHARARRHLELALTAGRRGARLVQQLLAFSRRQHLSPVVTDVGQLIGEVIELGKRLLPANIDVRSLTDTACHANVDPAQLESAVLNLVVNARDAMLTGGTLTVTSRAVRVPTTLSGATGDIPPGNYATITVSDTGTGIPEHVLKQVFEPFFTTKATGAGTGLGLNMAKGFAEQSGGHVQIASQPGRGTEVSLYLPLVEATGTNVESKIIPRRTRTGTETILVVEDDVEVRAFLELTLTELGYRIFAVGDGHAALTFLDGNDVVDLLFTDVMLPGPLNGHALAGC